LVFHCPIAHGQASIAKSEFARHVGFFPVDDVELNSATSNLAQRVGLYFQHQQWC
jgi:hypothetical protein